MSNKVSSLKEATVTKQSDLEEVRLALKDKKHRKELLVKCKEWLKKLVGSHLRGYSAADVNDVVQEAWIKVNKNLGKFRGDGTLFKWVYTIGLNTMREFMEQPTHQIVSLDDAEDMLDHEDQATVGTIAKSFKSQLGFDPHTIRVAEEVVRAFDDITERLRKNDRSGRNVEMWNCILEYYDIRVEAVDDPVRENESLKGYVTRRLCLVGENEYQSSRQAIERACRAIDYGEDIYKHIIR
jgi:RNA polymerase sigma factor (sigma-70 family)